MSERRAVCVLRRHVAVREIVQLGRVDWRIRGRYRPIRSAHALTANKPVTSDNNVCPGSPVPGLGISASPREYGLGDRHEAAITSQTARSPPV